MPHTDDPPTTRGGRKRGEASDLRILFAGGGPVSADTTWRFTLPADLTPGACAVSARFRPLRGAHASVAVHVNGRRVGAVEPRDGAEVTLTGDHPSALRPGENEVSLVFGGTRPGNQGVLLYHVAIRYRVRLEPAAPAHPDC